MGNNNMKTLKTIGISILGIAVLVALVGVLISVPKAESPSSSGSGVHITTDIEDVFRELEGKSSDSGPSLNITTHTDKEIIGGLKGVSSDVTFEARMETPYLVSVRVQVNDLILDASAKLGEDGQKQLVVINGYGKTLSLEDKKALIELSGLLEQYLDPYKRQLPPHEGLLVQSTMYWAEAPVGYTFTRQEVRPPSNP
jgi:hypothetical protein